MGAEEGVDKGAEKEEEEEVVVAVDAVAAVEKKVISSCTSNAVHSSLRIPTATLLLFFISAVFSFVSLASFSSFLLFTSFAVSGHGRVSSISAA